jgi:F-type H+-transporting ATPase subunit b
MVEINLTLIVQLVNFLVVYWLLKAWFFRPLLAVMDERKKLLDSLTFGFADEKDELKRMEDEYSAKMRVIYREASKIKTEARHKAEQEKFKMLERSKSEAAGKLAEKKEKLDLEFVEIRSGLSAEETTLQELLEKKLLS